MDYYQQTLYIPTVDETDTVTGKVERWEAHRNGILHRGFTVAVIFDGKIICQHRKHPVFDGVIDMTASSHPLYDDNDVLEDTVAAVERTLAREWSIDATTLRGRPRLKGKTLYRSSDGTYVEHELCHYYEAEVTELPQFNPEYAYGLSLLSIDELMKTSPADNRSVAPWVSAAIKDGVFHP